MMRFYVQGGGSFSLTKQNFVASGGEGKIYARGQTGYKVFHDPAKAIPVGKIQELAGISDPNVIKPHDALYRGKKAEHVGHTFRFVSGTWTLCQLFPRAFREREGFDHDTAIKLMRKIQEGIESVHRAGVLVVDLNEMNFLVSRDFATPYFIDVDSYQTSHHAATAIMPSVRDPKVQGLDFTELSDWFSFAIVSFQLLVGIHPFKGKHPSVKGFEERMRASLSVFDDAVSIPKAAYEFDVIPEAYRDWYRALFVEGRRDLPPAELVGTIIVRPVVRKITGTDNLEITEIHAFEHDVRAVFKSPGGPGMVVHAGNDVFSGSRMVWHDGAHEPFVVGFTAHYGHAVTAAAVDGNLALRDITANEPLPVMLRADEVMAHEGTVYVRNRDKVLEVIFGEVGNRIVVGSRLAANVLEHASRLYEGVAIQSLLGEPHVSLFPRPGACYQVMVPELKGHKVVEAKLQGEILMVMAAEQGTYHRYVFRFDEDYAKYDVRKVEDVTPAGLNFVTLDSGICVCLDEEDRLEIFSSRKGSKSVKTIEDPVLGGDMRLVKDGGRVQFHRGNKLYGMKMR